MIIFKVYKTYILDLNVLNQPLQCCCTSPLTGFYRDGFCKTGAQDYGTHTVCAIVTNDFLEYSLSRGNDLITPIPQWNFPGLKPGDHWCLCISRWLQAEKVGKAPLIKLEATHIKSLDYCSLDLLKKYEFQKKDLE